MAIGEENTNGSAGNGAHNERTIGEQNIVYHTSMYVHAGQR